MRGQRARPPESEAALGRPILPDGVVENGAQGQIVRVWHGGGGNEDGSDRRAPVHRLAEAPLRGHESTWAKRYSVGEVVVTYCHFRALTSLLDV